MRLNQYIARGSGLSRRSADEAIDKGRVLVNGQLARKGMQITEDDAVLLDNQKIEFGDYKYIMLYKPTGYLSSRKSQGGVPTIYDLLPPELHNLKTVGRLDKDTSGLLLLSDDGEFTHRMTHPKFKKKKIYSLRVDKDLKSADIETLNSGVKLEDGKSLVKVLKHDGPTCRVELREGRNRQIRRTFEALGYKVIQLHRFELDKFKLDLNKPGDWKYIKN